MTQYLAGAALAILALAQSAAAQPVQGAAPASTLKLDRVVLLMRHGVRPSTKFPATPAGTTRDPWPAWSTAAGDLTPHGADAIRRLGAYDRTLFAEQGLLPASGCAAPGTVVAWASSASRAIKTGKAFLETLQPGCAVPLDHPVNEDDDAVFHPLDGSMEIDGQKALAAAQALLPPGGVAEEVRRNADAFAVLERVIGCCPGDACATTVAKRQPVCDTHRASELLAEQGDKPDLDGALGFASTAGQTILLQYLEGMPMRSVGWGRTSKRDIRTMLRFHPIKFRYETRPAYVAERVAAPIARRIGMALNQGEAKVTLLFGHDSNLAALGGFYDLHWTMADYPRDDISPGGAIGFERWSDPRGNGFVRAFVQSQTMDQVRQLAQLGKRNPPDRRYIAIPGCGDAEGACPLATFNRITAAKLGNPAER
jgi:4-phytase/acid phosphatase